MKDFIQHRRDVQNEFRSGRHTIKWISQDTPEQISIFQYGSIDPYHFQLWHSKHGSIYVDPSCLKTYNRKNILCEFQVKEGCDYKNYCRDYYLNFLSRIRNGDMNKKEMDLVYGLKDVYRRIVGV